MKPTVHFKPKNGFALVVTISMMVLLTIVVVATLSLSTITLRSVDKDSAKAVARANARLALMLAIGQLQKEAGPDQRVTATAEIEDSKENPNWTGVWKAGPNETNSKPTWLVSGANPNPDTQLSDADSALLSGVPQSSPNRKELRAEYVNVEGRQLDGRYAYWVGDEGTKARVDVANPEEKGKDLGFRERVGRSQSPQEPGFAAFDRKHRDMWAGFDSDYSGSVDRKSLASMGTVALAAKDSGDIKREDIPNYYFNDLTTGGFGLPVNVQDGGMKSDLSLIFDRSQEGKSFVSTFFGATPNATTIAGARVYNFNVSDYQKFGLSPTIMANHPKGFVGPNWGTLFNYSRLWETVTGNVSPMIGLNPRVDSNLRQPGWKPYNEEYKGTGFQEDVQHTNSGLSPVISVAQLSFLLGSETSTNPGLQRRIGFSPSLFLKPVVGLWNPYNVHIKEAVYQLEWATGPVFELSSPTAEKVEITSGNPARTVNYAPTFLRVWLREYWSIGNDHAFPSDTDGNGSYIRLKTTSVDFQPGEFRLFSVDGNPLMTETNALVPTLNPTGAFQVKLYLDPKTKTEENRLIYAAGTTLYVPQFSLQDTDTWFRPHTRAKFPQIGLGAANSWFTLKAGASTSIETHLNRYTDIWNGQKTETEAAIDIPEPITQGGAPPNPFVVDGLGRGKHIGTWRFYTRNSTEIVDAREGLRGWIDCNPRVMSSVMRYDGSKNVKGGFQGWSVTSNLMGAENMEPSSGDGKGGNRGLVKGGGTGVPIPEGDTTSGRWQGYGGPSSTSNGFNNVIVYDVPQAPLTSLGQFQHANLSRYNYEPGFVVGNSYANPRIPSGSISAPDFGGMGFPAVDISYEVNKRLWDSCFFSTLGLDYKDGGGGSFDNAFDYNALVLRKKSLPNPRMVFSPLPGDKSIDKIISDAGSAAPEAIATRILIEGAFNINSTSKTAWKAILSTMDGSELPVINKTTVGQTGWTTPKGIRFSRFNHVILDAGFAGGNRTASYWQGWRELSDDDLDDLAEEIVNEVKDRGPFRSMADFVNRNPDGKQEHQLKGALQAAIDKVANKAISEDIGMPAAKPQGKNFESAGVGGENQSAGSAGYLLQGDVLQCIAPVMQVRSDYFRIRTCGEALDKTGKVIAKAYCEAFVQRIADYVDTADKPETAFAKLSSETNKEFGRRFQLISFRWLNPSEI